MDPGTRVICHLEAFRDERPEFCLDGICCGIYKKQSVLLTLSLWVCLLVFLALPVVCYILYSSSQNTAGNEEVSERGNHASTEENLENNSRQPKKQKENNENKGNKNGKKQEYLNESKESSDNCEDVMLEQQPTQVYEDEETLINRNNKYDTIKEDNTEPNKHSNKSNKKSNDSPKYSKEDGGTVEDNFEKENKPFEKDNSKRGSKESNNKRIKRNTEKENFERESLTCNDELIKNGPLKDQQFSKDEEALLKRNNKYDTIKQDITEPNKHSNESNKKSNNSPKYSKEDGGTVEDNFEKENKPFEKDNSKRGSTGRNNKLIKRNTEKEIFERESLRSNDEVIKKEPLKDQQLSKTYNNDTKERDKHLAKGRKKSSTFFRKTI